MQDQEGCYVFPFLLGPGSRKFTFERSSCSWAEGWCFLRKTGIRLHKLIFVSKVRDCLMIPFLFSFLIYNHK